MTGNPLGPIVYSFFVDRLAAQKGLRRSSIQSYRDTLRLFLVFTAKEMRRPITGITLADLSLERVLRFLRHLEIDRHNHPSTRNQRLAALHTFFEYVATRCPEMLSVCQQVAAIPTKRTARPETRFLERDEVTELFAQLPTRGRRALRDRALLMFLYNTGARAQEVADLRVEMLDLEAPARVRLHGKGDKWRTCPLWSETGRLLRLLLAEEGIQADPHAAVFRGPRAQPLTRYGIYKLVRRHARMIDAKSPSSRRRTSPHIWRHTTAMHLLEAGVEVNVIRGWLGHVSAVTTDRYTEISLRAKEAALRACEPPESSAGFPRRAVWRDDKALTAWLGSL